MAVKNARRTRKVSRCIKVEERPKTPKRTKQATQPHAQEAKYVIGIPWHSGWDNIDQSFDI
jgi:hypothetical protein